VVDEVLYAPSTKFYYSPKSQNYSPFSFKLSHK